MILESLEIQRQRWGDYNGQTIGKIKFSSPAGEISLALGPDHIIKILAICADSLVVVSQDVAKNLTSQILDQTPNLLEDPNP